MRAFSAHVLRRCRAANTQLANRFGGAQYMFDESSVLMLSDEVRTAMRQSVLCWLATATRDGVPNVSPKEMFVPCGDDCVLIANIASPGSVANIAQNAAVCVSFVDVFRQKGFKIRGRSTLVEASDVEYPRLLAELHRLGGDGFPIRSIIKVAVEAVEPIIAPSYWLFPETTEQSQIAQAMASYGVQPRS